MTLTRRFNSMPLIAVVYGSRTFSDYTLIERLLVGLQPEIVFHGACETGVDAMADHIAKRLGIQRVALPAPWDGPNGTQAGPLRNKLVAQMAVAHREYTGLHVAGFGFREFGASAGTDGMKAICDRYVRDNAFMANRCGTVPDWRGWFEVRTFSRDPWQWLMSTAPAEPQQTRLTGVPDGR
jgi:hypothetical protein